MRDKVHLQALHDEGVWDTPKHILEIEEGDMGSFLLLPSVLHNLLHGQVMLYASVHARDKSPLHFGINEFVATEEGGEPRVEKQVEGFANTAAQSNHPKVGGVGGLPLLVDELNN